MLNWNTDETAFKKLDPQGYKLWRLVQLINYGLDGEKLDPQEVKRAWPQIEDQLDPDAKKTLEYFLWHKKWRPEPGLRPDRHNFWQWLHKKKVSQLRSISLAELHLAPSTTTTASQKT